jgi:morphogenetic protein associated with SpoVID
MYIINNSMINKNWMRSISQSYRELKEIAAPQAPMMPQGQPRQQPYHFPFRQQTAGMPLGGQPKPDLAPPQQTPAAATLGPNTQGEVPGPQGNIIPGNVDPTRQATMTGGFMSPNIPMQTAMGQAQRPPMGQMGQMGMGQAPMPQMGMRQAPMAQMGMRQAQMPQMGQMGQMGMGQAPMPQMGMRQAQMPQMGQMGQMGMGQAPMPQMGMGQAQRPPMPQMGQMGMGQAQRPPMPQMGQNSPPRVPSKKEIKALMQKIGQRGLPKR